MADDSYRVLESTRDRGAEWLLLDVHSADPTYVVADPDAYEGDLADRVAALEPGNRVRATFDWSGDRPRFASLERETETVFEFVRPDPDTELFEAAKECWRGARGEGSAMNSRVTYSTDNDPNGVVYTFAEQRGERDLFGEFRDGIKPLDPLVARLAETEEPPFATFVIDHPAHPFVVVYLVVRRDGILAETVRDTYRDD
ncbi:MAG: DUF6663 family protein [Haloarculaceae archaeon]